MPKVGKPKSKRVPVRLRHKIEKASAAKQRKNRKLAKQNPEWRSRLKKDPGIPNLFPGKQQMLHELEESKIRREQEQKAKRDEARKRKDGENEQELREQAEADTSDAELLDYEDVEEDEGDEPMKSNDGASAANPMAALLASARDRAQKFEQQGNTDDESDDSDRSSFKVHAESRKSNSIPTLQSHTTAFNAMIASSDILLYVVDARDPVTTRSPQVERQITSDPHKRLLLVLNKIDLVPPSAVKGWLVHLRRAFSTLPLLSSSSLSGSYAREHAKIGLTAKSTTSVLFSTLKRRSNALSNNPAATTKSGLTVGILGHPNTGKSTIINSLLSILHTHPKRRTKTAAPTGAEAGVTTALRSVKLDSKLRLLDAPGIVFPFEAPPITSTGSASSQNEKNLDKAARLALLNALPSHSITDPISAVNLLLSRAINTSFSSTVLSQSLAESYAIPGGALASAGKETTTQFLIAVARARGRLGKGGVPNLQASAMTVLGDWWAGRLRGGWVEAPEAAAATGTGAWLTDSSDEKKVVTKWAEEFKLDGLWGDDIFIAEDAGADATMEG